MNRYCILNGVLVPEKEALLHCSDLAIRRGFGIFDFFRTQFSQPLYLDRYIARIIKGAEMAGMSGQITKERIIGEVNELIKAHSEHPEEGGIRLVMTGGYNSWEPVSSNFIITYESLKPFDSSLYKEGAIVISHNFRRELPEVKTISYMTAIQLTPQIRQAGAMEVLYHDEGTVHEFSRSNIFIVKSGQLITPEVGILFGVTRGLVLEIAEEFMQVTKRKVTLDEVMDADEAFMTSTIKRIIPVVRVDDKDIGNGAPGSVTKALMKKLAERDKNEYETRGAR